MLRCHAPPPTRVYVHTCMCVYDLNHFLADVRAPLCEKKKKQAGGLIKFYTARRSRLSRVARRTKWRWRFALCVGYTRFVLYRGTIRGACRVVKFLIAYPVMRRYADCAGDLSGKVFCSRGSGGGGEGLRICWRCISRWFVVFRMYIGGSFCEQKSRLVLIVFFNWRIFCKVN